MINNLNYQDIPNTFIISPTIGLWQIISPLLIQYRKQVIALSLIAQGLAFIA